jgi:hypothetical protein
MSKWVSYFRICPRAHAICAFLGLVFLSTLAFSSFAHAKRPYSAQIGGFITATLETLITGEFAGRSPSNADAMLRRPVCKANDYDDLRRVSDQAALDALRRRCKFVEGRVDQDYVHKAAYLPAGYCDVLKDAFERLLREFEDQELDPDFRGIFVFEYKGSRFRSSTPRLARQAQLTATCQPDGSLRISAPRKRR